MEEAKESDSTTRTQALKDLYVKKKDTAIDNKEKASQTASERGSQFAVRLSLLIALTSPLQMLIFIFPSSRSSPTASR